jgi:hypothetical protein
VNVKGSVSVALLQFSMVVIPSGTKMSDLS